MNKNYLILGLCALFTLAACEQELEGPAENHAKVVTTSTIVGISDPATKVDYTAKQDENGKSVFGVTWSENDAIYVTTAAQGAADVTLTKFDLSDGEGTAEGVFNSETEITGDTFSAVYSATAPAVTADNKIKVEFPSVQTYVENGLAANTIPMYAVGTDPKALNFNYGSGIVRLKLWNAEATTVTKIEIVTDVPASGNMLACPAEAEFPCGYEVAGGTAVASMNGVVVKSGAPEYVTTYNIPNGVVLGTTAETATQFNIALAASTHCENDVYQTMTVKVYTNDGKIMEKTKGNFQVLAGTVHEFPGLGFEATDHLLAARLQGATSSTLSFQWSKNGFTDVEEDATHPYEVALYKDAACTDLFVSWVLEANSTLYTLTSGSDVYHFQPAFNFSGLTANTTYYFKVRNTATGEEIEPFAAKTEAFTIVTVGEDEVAEGGTVLAEDFSELVWGSDHVFTGISSIAVNKKSDMIAASGVNPTDAYKLINARTDDWLYAGDLKTTGTRLEGWGHMGNNTNSPRLYGHLGHVRVGTATDWSRIVTPVLSNLQETATVKVSFKASPYYDYDQQNKMDLLPACITVLDGKINVDSKKRVTATNERVAKEFNLTDAKNVWTEYSYEIINVTPTSRISIGAISEAGKKHRMHIDDIKIEVVKYEAYPVAELQGATSSTLSFKWSVNNFTDAAVDYVRESKVSLYRDAECSDLVVSWDITTTNATASDFENLKTLYESKQPAFVFSGLNPNTTYYFTVKDIESGLTSSAISATTSSFTPVVINAANKVEAGQIALAEDFSEIPWYGDEVYRSVSCVKSSFEAFAMAEGEHPSGYKFVKAGIDQQWCNNTSLQAATAGTRLSDWQHTTVSGQATPRVYYRAGYLKLGTGKQWGRIVTPTLSNLSGNAKVKVSFKACPYDDTEHNFIITVIENAGECNAKKFLTRGETTTEVTKVTEKLTTTRNKWTYYDFEIDGVTPTSRISIGGEGVYSESTVEKDVRMYIDEIVITVVSYDEAAE